MNSPTFTAQDTLFDLINELSVARTICTGFLDESLPLFNEEQAKAASVILAVLDLAIEHATAMSPWPNDRCSGHRCNEGRRASESIPGRAGAILGWCR